MPMQWNMDTLAIVGYDSMDHLHRRLKRELTVDPKIFMYFRNTIEQYLTRSDHPHSIEVETAYLIAQALT